MEFAVIQQAIAKFGKKSLVSLRVLITRYIAKLTVGNIINKASGFNAMAQQASFISQNGK